MPCQPQRKIAKGCANPVRNFFKAVSASLCSLCVAVFGILGYGALRVPDSFYVTENQQPALEAPFQAGSKTAGLAGNASFRVGALSADTYDLQIRALGLFPVKTTKVTVSQRRYVVLGGTVFGIKLYTQGVMVVGVDAVTTASGPVNPAEKAGLKEGDVILKIEGEAVQRNKDVSAAVEKSGGAAMEFCIQRDEKEMTLQFTPALSAADNNYKAGIWVRDSSAGIGTLTFVDPQTKTLAGLGHAVCDVDTGETIPIAQGEAVQATVKGCYKSSGGKPGELVGVFMEDTIGTLLQNGDTGLYGVLENAVDANAKQTPVALKTEVQEGAAHILVTLDGVQAKYYDVELLRVYPNETTTKKNMVIKVTDAELIAQTGGIVQGMSGSPIVQNGMLVGAVTHVFVNNPQQGYGIFAQTMLESVDALYHGLQKRAS